jgi:hypothetical protein
MHTQQMKWSESWRCRREQYLRESGRHAELIKEGYASANSTTDWIVIIGGRTGDLLKGQSGMRLFPVKGQASCDTARGTDAGCAVDAGNGAVQGISHRTAGTDASSQIRGGVTNAPETKVYS